MRTDWARGLLKGPAMTANHDSVSLAQVLGAQA